MELYRLDDTFRPDEVIESYSSLVWAERFNSVGEVQIEFPFKQGLPSTMQRGTWLSLSDSDRIMRIDTIDIGQDDDGAVVFKVEGQESLDILRFRNAWKDLSGLGENPSYSYKTRPARAISNNIRRAIVGDLTGDWTPSSNRDPVPNMVWVTYEQGTGLIPYPTTDITFSMDQPMTVLDHITEIAKNYLLGFRCYLQKYDRNIYVQVYPGYDRSVGQTALAPVIFASKMDNISNISLFESNRDFNTSHGIYTKSRFRYVDRLGFESQRGFDKRSAWSTAQDPEGLTSAELNEWVDAKCLEELTSTDQIVALDGEVSRSNRYVYNVDYFLGDRVTIMSDWGFSGNVRITEQVFTSDSEGERSIPTFEIEQVYSADSWMGANPTEYWDNAEGTWAER